MHHYILFILRNYFIGIDLLGIVQSSSNFWSYYHGYRVFPSEYGCACNTWKLYFIGGEKSYILNQIKHIIQNSHNTPSMHIILYSVWLKKLICRNHRHEFTTFKTWFVCTFTEWVWYNCTMHALIQAGIWLS